MEMLDISTTPITRISSNNSLGNIYSLCALPQTYVIAAGNNNGDIYILNMTVQIYTFCTGGGGIVCLIYVESNNLLWAGDTDGNIYIVDITSKECNKLEQNIHPGCIFVLEEGKGGQNGYIFSAGKCGVVGVWGIHDQSLLFHFTLPGKRLITSLSFSTPHNYIILGDVKGYLQLWHLTKENQALIYAFRPHMRSICHGGGIQNVWGTHLYVAGC